MDVIRSRLDAAEEDINELEDITIESIQNKQNEKQNEKQRLQKEWSEPQWSVGETSSDMTCI